MAAFALSLRLNKGKFEMEDILNATLAGGITFMKNSNFKTITIGVIMGAVCDIIIAPFGSMCCGLLGLQFFKSLNLLNFLKSWNYIYYRIQKIEPLSSIENRTLGHMRHT